MHTERLTREQRAQYDEQGFVRLRGFIGPEVCERMLERVVALARAHAGGDRDAPGLVLPEANLAGSGGNPEDLVSKIFRLHRDGVFAAFAADPRVTESLVDLIGPRLDCFLSQFIFKNPGAWGQPWHQDSFYFAFEPARPIVGAWLAVTEATLENGCLHVLPGSHREPVHEHVPDRRPNANLGYVEIVDHDMAAAEPVLMDPGDLLLFDSHLMHRSTDNESTGIRAAMVFHYAATGTVDSGPRLVNDFVTVR
jgi:ectoine hydroxylase-related dioxygenase (phytanoyl-CoA dioxygenase family)